MKQALGALLIVAVTAFVIRAIAQRKNEELAGPATYVLGTDGPEREALDALFEELGRLGHAELGARLAGLHAEEMLWVAPYMPEGNQAVYVSSLGIVERIYVDRGSLLLQELPFPDAGLPEDWRRLYALVKLGGTLYHELQHLDGILDEAEAYRREEAWYQEIQRAPFVLGLEGSEERRYSWAIESAELGAREAARKAAAATAG